MTNFLKWVVLLILTVAQDVGEMCSLDVGLDNSATGLIGKVHAVPHVDNWLVVAWVRDSGEVLVGDVLQKLPLHR